MLCRNLIQARPLSFGLSHSLSLFGPGIPVCSIKPIFSAIGAQSFINLVSQTPNLDNISPVYESGF